MYQCLNSSPLDVLQQVNKANRSVFFIGWLLHTRIYSEVRGTPKEKSVPVVKDFINIVAPTDREINFDFS